MSNFSGHKPFASPRFLGAVDHDNATRLPMGVPSFCRNARFDMETVGCRYGLQQTMRTSGGDENITGLGMLNFIGETDEDIPLVFTSEGVLLKESPVGSGTLVPVTPWFGSLPSLAYAQMAFAYNRGFMCFTDLTKGLSYPAVYSGLTDSFDPVSMRPYGAYWEASAYYNVGEVISPVTANGHLYQCTAAGTSGANEPAWTTGVGDVVNDGPNVQWTERTPTGTGRETAWAPGVLRSVNDVITPAIPNGYLYRCTGAGTSGEVEPIWTTNAGAPAHHGQPDVGVSVTEAITDPGSFVYDYSYVVIANFAGGIHTGASLPGTVSAIGYTVDNVLHWADLPGATSYDIYRIGGGYLTKRGAAGATGKIANVLPGVGTYTDHMVFPFGMVAVYTHGDGSAPPTNNSASTAAGSSITDGSASWVVCTWQGASSYSQGATVTPIIHNGHQYRCTRAGTTGDTEPTWTTGVGDVIYDGPSWVEDPTYAGPIATWNAGHAYALNAIVQPSTSNGRVYRCTKAGTSGGTEPVWTNYDVSSVIVDNGAQWTCITWRANSGYSIGALVSPLSPNGHIYRCDVAGTSGVIEPTWTMGTGDTVRDGMQWTEDTKLRYFAVMFRTEGGQLVSNKGYISGYNAETAVIAASCTSTSTLIDMSGIATGPANVIERIIAFGMLADEAGNKGKLAYIPADDTIANVTYLKTVLEDNTSISATFSFDDTYLGRMFGTETDVSDYYLKMRVPPCRDIAYLESLDRFVYTCAEGYESSVLITPRGDPETLYGGISVVDVAPQNGQRTVCVREIKTGEILCWKDDSIHSITPQTGVDPSGWEVLPKSLKAGACGPRAVAIGSTFAIFAHRSGVWKYDFQTGSIGEFPVSAETVKAWDSLINWDAKETIWIHINEISKEVRIGVPMVGSSVANKTFTMSYVSGWGGPTFAVYGKQAASGEARKWSRPDDISATMAITAKRKLDVPVDSRINEQQILYASSLSDGMIRMEVPDSYHDDLVVGGVVTPSGIDFRYATAFAQGSRNEVFSLIGLAATARGYGELIVVPFTDDSMLECEPRQFSLGVDGLSLHFADGRGGDESEHWAYMFTNGYRPDGTGVLVADQWFELLDAIIYADLKWNVR